MEETNPYNYLNSAPEAEMNAKGCRNITFGVIIVAVALVLFILIFT